MNMQQGDLQFELRRYAQAIQLAEQDGDAEAADYLRMEQKKITEQLAGAYRAEQAPGEPGAPTSAMGGGEKLLANVGAGMMEWPMGLGQTAGLVSGEDYRDKQAMDQQLAAGTTGGGFAQFGGNVLPTMMAPLGAGVRGAMAVGGVMGAASPTANDNILAGKLGNTLAGAFGGGAGYKAATALQPAGRRVGDFFIEQGFGTAGQRQRLAERALLSQFDDLGSTANRIRANAAREARIPGTRPTTGQLAESPELLETERALRNVGGEAGRPFNDAVLDSNNARLALLQRELGGDAEAIRAAAGQGFETAKAGLQLAPGGVDPNNQIRKLFSRAANQLEAPALKSEMLGLRARWEAIAAMPVKTAKQRAEQLEKVHQFRMTALDDALSRAMQADTKAAKLARGPLQQLKSVIDTRVQNRLAAGDWKGMMRDYSREMTRASQQERASGILSSATSPGRPVMSDMQPSLQSSRKMLGDELRPERALDDFGNPALSASQRQAIEDVSGSLNRESLTRGPDIMGSGSSTAANLNTMARLNQNPLGMQALAKDALPTLLAGLNEPVLGMTVFAQRQLAHRAQRDIAQRLITMYRDPQAALAVLDRAVRSGQMTAANARGVAQQLLLPRAGTPTLGSALATRAGAGAGLGAAAAAESAVR